MNGWPGPQATPGKRIKNQENFVLASDQTPNKNSYPENRAAIFNILVITGHFLFTSYPKAGT
jgi:hypothetical protein